MTLKNQQTIWLVLIMIWLPSLIINFDMANYWEAARDAFGLLFCCVTLWMLDMLYILTTERDELYRACRFLILKLVKVTEGQRR